MSAHALLSPSAAHRWLNCPLAPRLEAQLPEKISDFARTGTLAHSVCEVTAKKKFKKIKSAEYTRTIKKLKTNPLWDDEMLTTAETYVEHLVERSMAFESAPYIAFEVQVDIADFVPESFGRCDCVMFGGDTLVITDYKHGTGVPVSACENPQMMLYALGALKVYRPIFGEAIKNIEAYIDQPRLNSYDGWGCSVEDLLKWGEEIKPKAMMAFMGFGEFHAGEWCKFCRANGQCKAQAALEIGAFDDFSEAVGGPVDILTPEEIGSVLERGKTLVDWYDAVKQVALERALNGTKIPGYKVVEGRSNRVWSDQDKALDALQAGGIDRAVIYDSVPKSLAQLEKIIGAKEFQKLVGSFVVRPTGKPTLVPMSDGRAEFSGAVADFAGVAPQS